MLRFLPAPLVGLLAGILYLLNVCTMAIIILITAAIRFLLPVAVLKRKLSYFIHEIIPPTWIDINNLILWLTTNIEWDVKGTGELKRDGWYFVICNHRSWIDIIVLEKIFNRKTPMLKFFMKQELLWMLPIAGVACYIMGFPFMKRHSKSYLKKHPEKIGDDVASTRRACEKFIHQPIAVINYIEGTRFTAQKHESQNSPYRYLLRPKAGGLAFVLSAMQNQLKDIINVTIIYPDPHTNLWRFLCGRVKKIVVRYEVIPVAKELQGDYYHNLEFRRTFQHWLNQRWLEKDKLIARELNNG